jgi:hypothetical protein
MATPRDLRNALDQGFVAENLLRLASLALERPVFDQCPAALLVLHDACWEAADRWDRGPVTVEDATRIRAELEPPMSRLVDSLLHETPTEYFNRANELAATLIATLGRKA